MISLLCVGVILYFLTSNATFSSRKCEQARENIYRNLLYVEKQRLNLLDSESLTLCVIVRIYGPQVSYLPVLALGFLHAGFDNVRIYVINTDRSTDSQLLFQTIDLINKIVLRTNYITFLGLGEPLDNDYGYTLTDRALDYLYDQYKRSPSICHYLIVTNGDNLYSRYLGNKTLPHMRAKKDIIVWDFVSRYHRPYLIQAQEERLQKPYRIFDDGTAKCVAVSLQRGGVDLGAAAYRLAFLYQYKLRFSFSNGTYHVESDGFFMDKASLLTNMSVIVRQTLFIHQ
ncbi:unnamed protein product [Rotaria magnacalcarata]|uniref:Uncharacterized protein n=1 Tax=Rotaria magnacalcarata TaxID=392030 RepID=A0A819IVC7_9BILA|nr:unnamed protein product [Rotaria magnacalcarata]CAF2040863.1 unnamed protein product [Rotaria magnacalcarata]CAF3919423.1 unnamed protein product [Rotaria magnacalcarata]CAF4421881.1 unnamed protein product [Rotaria magnacalcarata]